MVSQKAIDEQLRKIDFNPKGWNKSEVAELHNIILPDEHIYECVNGIYEGGFALLVASDIRILLVDKKPMGFLNVEDLRFDMINEIDYNHRMMGASTTIASGSKTMTFRSYNKERLRKLIGHVQHCMAEGKKKESSNAEGQHQHLEQINQQLQAYLVAQFNQQQKLQDHLTNLQTNNDRPAAPAVENVEMSNDLKNFLYAKGLKDKYEQETGQKLSDLKEGEAAKAEPIAAPPATHAGPAQNNQLAEIYADGIEEVFGKHRQPQTASTFSRLASFDVNPFKVAISKLPIALFSRRFGVKLPPMPSWPGHAQDTQTLNLNSTTSSGRIS